MADIVAPRIWVPKQTVNGQALTYSDLFSFKSPDKSLALLRDTLNRGYIDYVRDRLTRTIGDEDSTLKARSAQMLDQLLHLPVRSRFSEKPEGKFPVIVYHHGYDGWGHENFLFAEYITSKGFVVVGTNYEWPDHEGSWEKGNSDIAHILTFAKHLPYVDSARIFALGHSWGAQALLYYDNTPTQPFQATVALHTTMEGPFKLDTITKWWSAVSKIMLDSTRKTSPTFLFAPEKPSNDYLIFRKSKSADYHYINVLNPIAHDGFISVDNMRYFLREHYQPKEDSILQKQFESYQEICKAIHEQLETNDINWSNYHRLVRVK
jgi:pimeloyl-ACP methyl ester carboxylesterase